MPWRQRCSDFRVFRVELGPHFHHRAESEPFFAVTTRGAAAATQKDSTPSSASRDKTKYGSRETQPHVSGSCFCFLVAQQKKKTQRSSAEGRLVNLLLMREANVCLSTSYSGCVANDDLILKCVCKAYPCPAQTNDYSDVICRSLSVANLRLGGNARHMNLNGTSLRYMRGVGSSDKRGSNYPDFIRRISPI